MATIKGENLRLLVGDDTEHLKCIAASTNCTVHFQMQIEEVTTKDTDSDWLEKEPVGMAWDMQVEALVIDDGDEEYRPGATAADQLQAGRVYVVQFAQTAGASGQQNRDKVQNRMMLTGSAVLNDFKVTSQNDEITTATAQFTGTGELTPYTE